MKTKSVFLTLLIGFFVPNCLVAQPPVNRPAITAYNVTTLPVWTIDSEGKKVFDPSILISQIKSQVAPESWNDRHRIVADTKKPVLLVLQTIENHRSIGILLRRLHAFASHDPVKRLESNLEYGKVSNQRILLYIGDSDSKSTKQLFEALDANEGFGKIGSEFILQCASLAQTRVLNDKLKQPELGMRHEFVVLDLKADVVERTRLDGVSKDKNLDLKKLETFLSQNRLEFPNARELLDDSLRLAVKTDRHVLIQMGGPNCGPCVRLANYLDANSAIISKDYIHLKLDRRMAEAKQVKKSLGVEIKTIPWMVILSKDNKVLQTSLSKKGNIAFPIGPSSIEHFKQIISKTSSRITKSELEHLIDGLNRD